MPITPPIPRAGDDARERSSMLGISFYPGITIYPPVSFGGLPWRQAVGYGYYGILVGETGQTILDYERMTRGYARGFFRGGI